MAEFCLNCQNRMDKTHLTEADVILDYDLCEGCGQYAPCVIRYRTPLEKAFWKLRHGRKKDDQ